MSRSKKVTASVEFVKNFDSVMKFYGCTSAEIEEAREAVRGDYANAESCYALMAGEISK